MLLFKVQDILHIKYYYTLNIKFLKITKMLYELITYLQHEITASLKILIYLTFI